MRRAEALVGANRLFGPEDVEAVERATLAAVPPLRLVEDDGWLLAANGGAIGRANSVTPLATGADRLDDKLDRALAFYAEAALPPLFRVSGFARPEGLTEALAVRGFAPEQPTVVMVASLDQVRAAFPAAESAQTAGTPDDAWRSVFLGPGFDPIEGALRAATLSRATGAVFASVREDDETVAIGAVCVRGDWAGLHGMRTAQVWRRGGRAKRVLAALVDAAGAVGATRLLLQVEADNAPARALYAALGFEAVYDYAYWRRPAGAET